AEASYRAVGRIAKALEFTVERTAQGILDIVTANMVRTIRAISVERGHDPRDFVLMPFGGAGPLHANGCARAIGIREVVVPYSPGILCAEGLLVADLSESWVRSQRMGVNDDVLPLVEESVGELLKEACRWWVAEAISEC